jgi:hypothetical protein
LSCEDFLDRSKKIQLFNQMSRQTLPENIPEITAPGFTFSKELNVEPIAGEGLVFLLINDSLDNLILSVMVWSVYHLE